MSLSRLPLPVDRAVLGKSFSYHARETGRLLQESLLQYHRTHASYEVPPDYITPTGDPLGACIALLRLLRQGSSAQVNALGIRSLLTALDAVPGFAWQVGTVAAGAVAASAARVSGLAAAHGGLLLDAVRQSTGEDRQTLARDYAALVAALESGAMSRALAGAIAAIPGWRVLPAFGAALEGPMPAPGATKTASPAPAEKTAFAEALGAFLIAEGHLTVPPTYVAPDGTPLGAQIAAIQTGKRTAPLAKVADTFPEFSFKPTVDVMPSVRAMEVLRRMERPPAGQRWRHVPREAIDAATAYEALVKSGAGSHAFMRSRVALDPLLKAIADVHQTRAAYDTRVAAWLAAPPVPTPTARVSATAAPTAPITPLPPDPREHPRVVQAMAVLRELAARYVGPRMIPPSALADVHTFWDVAATLAAPGRPDRARRLLAPSLVPDLPRAWGLPDELAAHAQALDHVLRPAAAVNWLHVTVALRSLERATLTETQPEPHPEPHSDARPPAATGSAATRHVLRWRETVGVALNEGSLTAMQLVRAEALAIAPVTPRVTGAHPDANTVLPLPARVTAAQAMQTITRLAPTATPTAPSPMRLMRPDE